VAIEQKHIVPTRTAAERILIPLGNRMNAGPLMDFALLLRDRHGHVPLYPLNVALDGPQADALVAQGESLLEDAVMRAVAADAPVEPLTRIDTNRAGGILRAIREKRISCVILGWRGKATGMGRFFQNVLDQVLDRTGTSLFVTRLPRPLNAARRMRLLLPPMIHHQPGFREAVRRCLRLSKQMGAPLLIMGAADALRALPKPSAGAAKAAWDTHELADWSQWSATLAALTEPEDFLAMISARRGRLPWHPGLVRNLQRLHTDYPDHNLLVIYPSELGVAEDGQEVEPVGADPTVQQAVLVETDTALAAPLQELLARLVPDPAGAETLAHELGGTEPVPLAEGVALLHTHTPYVEGTRIGLVLARGGAKFTGDHAPFFLIFVLISEQGLSPQEHLRALAGLARLARDQAELERLRTATSEDACRRVLS
jgi:nucleotide-binding universal stress UspA family protein